MASGGKDWQFFKFKSDSGRHRSGCKIYYYHWLPEDQKDLLPKEDSQLNNTNIPEVYKEFETLIHATTFKNANDIFRDGFKFRPVADHSVVNNSYYLMNWNGKEITPRPQHPVHGMNMLWFGPCTFEELQNPTYAVKRYGNVVFSMDTMYGNEGIIRDNLKLYFVEVIEYLKQSACRILVSYKHYPELRLLDPTMLGGPLYKNSRKFYYTSQLKCHDGRIVDNILEIMLEDCPDPWIRLWRKENLSVSFCFCKEPKNEINNAVVCLEAHEENEVMSDLKKNILKLAITNVRNFKLRTPFPNKKIRDIELKKELESVHKKAIEKYDRMRGSFKTGIVDLIDFAVNGIQFMSKRQLEESYLNMLCLIQEEQHSELLPYLFERIEEIKES